MNNQDVKAVENALTFYDYMDGIHEIIDSERNKWPDEGSIVLMSSINSFDYGVIIGKRLERAKKRGKENNFKKGGM